MFAVDGSHIERFSSSSDISSFYFQFPRVISHFELQHSCSHNLNKCVVNKLAAQAVPSGWKCKYLCSTCVGSLFPLSWYFSLYLSPPLSLPLHCTVFVFTVTWKDRKSMGEEGGQGFSCMRPRCIICHLPYIT